MRDRPTVVTVLAILWVLLAVLFLAGSAMGFYIWSSGSFGDDVMADSSDFQRPWLLRHYGLLVSVQLVVGLITFAASVGLFRLREWARTTIQALSWLGLASMVAMSVYQIFVTRSFYAEDGGAGMLYVSIGAVVFVSLFWMTPLVLTLWALNRPDVREAFAGS